MEIFCYSVVFFYLFFFSSVRLPAVNTVTTGCFRKLRTVLIKWRLAFLPWKKKEEESKAMPSISKPGMSFVFF